MKRLIKEFKVPVAFSVVTAVIIFSYFLINGFVPKSELRNIPISRMWDVLIIFFYIYAIIKMAEYLKKKETNDHVYDMLSSSMILGFVLGMCLMALDAPVIFPIGILTGLFLAVIIIKYELSSAILFLLSLGLGAGTIKGLVIASIAVIIIGSIIISLIIAWKSLREAS